MKNGPFIKKERESIYVCNTYHHVLISCIKAMQNTKKPDIMICYDIIDSYNLIRRLKKSNIFNNIYYLDRDYSYPSNNLFTTFFWKFFEVRYIKKHTFLHKVLNNKDIYVFLDYNALAYYLKAANIKYHLIEDGVDDYKTKTFSQLKELWKRISTKPSIKQRIGYICFPYHRNNIKYLDKCKNVIDIEVNDDKDICLNNKSKIIVVPKESLIKYVKDNKKEQLLSNIFIDSPIVFVGRKNVIILGSCLPCDKLISVPEAYKKYESIFDKYRKQSYSVFFKPHPRDLIKWSFKNVSIISATFPSEIIQFFYDENIAYYIGVATSATKTFNQSKVINYETFDNIE